MRVLIFILIVLSACNREWPTIDYSAYTCKYPDIPPHPSCVDQTGLSETFDYNAQFNACKTDIHNYEIALNTHYACATSEVKTLLEEVNQGVIEILECYDNKFEAYDEVKDINCPRVTVPRNLEMYSVNSTVSNLVYADTVEYSANIPFCVREQYPAPTNKISYEGMCRDDITNFLTPSNPKSAQSQYNKFSTWLNSEINARLSMVVEQFNCKAKGDYICSMPLF